MTTLYYEIYTVHLKIIEFISYTTILHKVAR